MNRTLPVQRSLRRMAAPHQVVRGFRCLRLMSEGIASWFGVGRPVVVPLLEAVLATHRTLVPATIPVPASAPVPLPFPLPAPGPTMLPLPLPIPGPTMVPIPPAVAIPVPVVTAGAIRPVLAGGWSVAAIAVVRGLGARSSPVVLLRPGRLSPPVPTLGTRARAVKLPLPRPVAKVPAAAAWPATRPLIAGRRSAARVPVAGSLPALGSPLGIPARRRRRWWCHRLECKGATKRRTTCRAINNLKVRNSQSTRSASGNIHTATSSLVVGAFPQRRAAMAAMKRAKW